MDEETAKGLVQGVTIYFPGNATRQATATGRVRERDGDVYVEIQEDVRKSWARAEDIEIQNITSIEDKIASLEFSSNLSLRQHLIFQKLCGRLIDVIYSMEATNTDFKAYQFKAVLKALDAPGKGI